MIDDIEDDVNADLIGRTLTMTDWRRPARPIDRTFTITGSASWNGAYLELDDGAGGSIIRPAGLVRRRMQIDAARTATADAV